MSFSNHPEPHMQAFQDYQRYDFSHFYFGGGTDVLDTLQAYNAWWDKAYPGTYHLYREPLTSPANPVIDLDANSGERQENLLNFSSYNYLGMANSPVSIAAVKAALDQYGFGASGGPILSGMFDIHRKLEAEVARFKKKEACTTFNSGYAANLGIISGIMRSGDTIFLDQYAHASLVDGAILSKAKTLFFRHNQAADLARKMEGVPGRKLVVLEGVYSMDGDYANLPELVETAKKYGARILLDEAHSAFICGPNGRGVAEHFGLEEEVDFHMGTFSKALGGIGGYACGSKEFINYLEAYARSRFFSCTLPPAVSAGILAALQHVEAHPEIRQRLWENVAYIRQRFQEEGIPVGHSVSQVIPVMVHDDQKAFSVGLRLRAKGIFLQPVTSPAVSKGKARLRLSVSALHTPAQLDHAVACIRESLQEENLL